MSEGLFALYAAVRGLVFVGLLLLIGSQAAGALLGRELGADPDLAIPLQHRLTRLPMVVAAMLLAAILARGVLQLLTFLDPGDAITFDLVRSVLLSGTWGNAWLLQVGGAVLLLFILRYRGDRATPADIPSVVLLIAILWAQTGMGHAAGDNWHGPLGRVLDFTHLLGGGLWLGTLAVLLMVALPLLYDESRLPALAEVVRRFSVYARIGASLLVISGAVAALAYAGSVSALLNSAWGRLLVVKLCGMLGVVALGWYNWRVVAPALKGQHIAAPARLRRAIRLELALGLVMLAITTLLVVSRLPSEG